MLKNKIVYLSLTVLLAVAAVFSGCSGGTTTTDDNTDTTNTNTGTTDTGSTSTKTVEITEAGSTTVQPVAEKLAAAYMAKHSNVKIVIQGGGSSVGVKSASEGTVDIGAASRELKSSEESLGLATYVLAKDGIAIVTNPSNKVTNLTTEQVLKIFAGEITNWSEVGGDNAAINVVAREEGSGTRAAFEEMVMGETLISGMAILQPSNGAVRTTVAGDKNSIGFLSFGYIDSSVKALSVDGVEGSVANAIGGSYPIVRPLLLLTKGQATGDVKAFLDYCLSDEGQAIVEEEGYISPTNTSSSSSGSSSSSSGSSTSTTKVEITEAGSTTVQPIAEKLAAAYMNTHSNVKVTIQGGGSSVGVKSASEGTVDIGAASRELKSSEMSLGLVEFVLARDGIAIATNPSNPVTNLTKEQVKQIFDGTITNWSEVGGPNKSINVVAREEGSGTRAAFEEMVMGEDLITAMAILQPSNGAVRTTIAGDQYSIGFLSFGYLDATVKALSVDGVAGTVANALNGSYPIVRPLLLLTKGEPTGEVKAFLDYCLGYRGQAMVEEEGYIAIGPTTPLSGTITEAGSTTVQPIAETLAGAFMAKYPNVKITIQGGGSSVGVKSVNDGTVDLGAASRELKQSELDMGVIPTVLAKDGIAIVTNPANGVNNLTMEQVKQIFMGQITNWSQVGGANANINIVAREEGSGTRAAFEEMVMGEDLIAAMAILQPSNGAVRTTVSGDANSIGFLSFGYLDDSVKAFSIGGIQATVSNALNGTYPIVRPLNFLTQGEPTGLVKEFLNYCLSKEGQTIVAEDYIPVINLN